ncbi:MAG TPA: PAS domain S-box protein, partial [Geminicoccaceae bacterium]|nr:PAS domain S-box protein [Geminicoccaceae bacterium]
MADSQGRVLTRRYSLLAAISAVPLLIVIVVLTLYQFTTQRQQLLDELAEQAIGHNILLGNVIKSVQDHVRTLAAWGEVYWRESDPTRPVPAPSNAYTIADGGLVVRGDDFAGRADAGREARLAGNLSRHMRLSHQEMPYLRWSYYLSAGADLMSVVPFSRRQSFGGELREAPPGRVLERFHDHAILALAKAGAPARDAWTEAYVDPTGAGWMVAYAAPVRAEDRLIGVVGATVLLDFLTGFLRAFDYPGGQLWLVNDQLQVLAAADGLNRAGLDLLRLGDVLPEQLGRLEPARLLAPSQAFRPLDGTHVLAQTVATTPWTLLYVISPEELTALILPRLLPYGIILACLILTLLLSHAFRQRLIVRPALAFADYIRAESADQSPAVPRLPLLWKPLAQAAAQAFRAQRTSLARIQDSEALKSAIISSAFDAVVAIDEHSRIVEFNPSAEQMFGVARAAALGQPLAELILPAHLRERHRDGMRRYLATGESAILGRWVEMEAVRSDGRPFPVEIAVTEVRQAGKRLFTAYLRDITERRAVERALRESEEHFRTIAETHPVPVAIVRLEDHRILHASRAYAELFEIPLAELPGQDIGRCFVDVKDRARLVAELTRNGAVHGFELLQRRADGTVFPTTLTSRLIEFRGTPAIICAIIDLTEQKRQEAEIARQREALRESEQRFRTIAEAHPVPVLIVRRADRRILHASQPFVELMRVAPSEVRDLTSKDIFANGEERQRIGRALREQHTVQDFEITMRRPDGSLFPAAITARPIQYHGEDAAVFGVVNLTEQKRIEAEMARQREALHQSEKLNALGSLLANVAHELNNPLSVVVGYATMMRDLAPDAATRERAVKVQAAAERCARIVRTFLAMARQKPEAWGQVQVNQVVEGALEVVGYGLRTTDVEVVLDLAPDLPPVSGDDDQLTLVMMNLIVNAQHALQTASPPRRLEITTARQNGSVRIEVADNGPGIPSTIAGRIFEPFFTTKPQGFGTGIGLSVCQNIVSAHHGEIAAASRPTGGSLFTITLPASPTGTPAPSVPAMAVGIRGRILIVEDEPEIAQMVAEVLRRDGHEIVLATSGREALARLATEPVDLILSDLRMPDLDGPGLHRELAAVAPALVRRVVFVTGDVLTPETDRFLGETGLPVLEKPLDPYDLRL